MPFFEGRYPKGLLKLLLRQQGRVRLSAGAGALDLSSAEARRMISSGAELAFCRTSLSTSPGPYETNSRSSLPVSVIFHRIETSLGELRDE